MPQLELTKLPAWGLENKKWGASEVRQRIAKDVINKTPKNTASAHEISKRLKLFLNIRKIVQWIPFVGIFAGLFGFLDFVTKSGRENYSIHYIERHAIAASGFGFLLPIGDLIATVVRNAKAKKLASPSSSA